MSKVGQRTWKQRSLVTKDPPIISLQISICWWFLIYFCDMISVLSSDNLLAKGLNVCDTNVKVYILVRLMSMTWLSFRFYCILVLVCEQFLLWSSGFVDSQTTLWYFVIKTQTDLYYLHFLTSLLRSSIKFVPNSKVGS